MKTLKLEVHYFCKSKSYQPPTNSDIGSLIDLFSFSDLLPQHFEEQHPEAKNKKMLYFVNPETNRAVYFKTDRIVITWAANPMGEKSDDIKYCLDEFLKFSSEAIGKYLSFTDSDSHKNHANRLSLVGNFLVPIDSDVNSRISQVIGANLPWSTATLNEVSVRTGDIETLEGLDESINSIIAINDGVIEKSYNGQVEKESCFLVAIDLNTRNENSEFRFNKDQAIDVWSKFSDKAQEKLAVVNQFLVNSEEVE